MAQPVAALAHTTPIILNQPADWDAWLDTIEVKAKLEKIWNYINPNIDKPDAYIKSVISTPLDQMTLI